MRRMPPLTAIEAFVQVARLGSVKAAAEELALSSPALSRRVQAMERFVGRALFDRRHQAMMLNAEGEALLARLAPALDALGAAIGETTGAVEHLKLRLGVLPLWASQQLMPRLDTLRTRHPEFHLDIDTQPHQLARLGDGLDAAVVLAREVDPSFHSRRLGRNRVVAIGARGLANGPEVVRTPDDIGNQTILIHRDMPELFNGWRRTLGLPRLEPAAIDQFDSGQLMLDAARQGIGVAIMLDAHLQEAHDDRLVALFPPIETSYSYWFACRRTALSRRAVKVFHDWLVGAFAEE